MHCPFVFLFAHFSIRCCNQRHNKFFLPGNLCKTWTKISVRKNRKFLDQKSTFYFRSSAFLQTPAHAQRVFTHQRSKIIARSFISDSASFAGWSKKVSPHMGSPQMHSGRDQKKLHTVSSQTHLVIVRVWWLTWTHQYWWSWASWCRPPPTNKNSLHSCCSLT